MACSASVVILLVYSSQANRHDVRNGNNVIMLWSSGEFTGTLSSGLGDVVWALPGDLFSTFFFVFLSILLLSSYLHFLAYLVKKSVEILLGQKRFFFSQFI